MSPDETQDERGRLPRPTECLTVTVLSINRWCGVIRYRRRLLGIRAAAPFVQDAVADRNAFAADINAAFAGGRSDQIAHNIFGLAAE